MLTQFQEINNLTDEQAADVMFKAVYDPALGNGVFKQPLIMAGRVTVREGSLIKYIYTIANFEPESGGVRPLLFNREDLLKSPIVLADRFSIPDNSINNERAEAFNLHGLTYTGVATLYTGTSIGLLSFFAIGIFGTSPAKFCNLIGGDLPLKQLSLDQSLVQGFGSFGSITDLRLIVTSGAWVDLGAGIIMTNSLDLRIIELIILNLSDKSSTFITIDGDQDLAGTISGLTATTFPNENVFDIRPNIGENSSITIEGCNFVGKFLTPFLGNVFKVGVTGNITAIDDASIGSTSISAVVNNGGVARFPFTGPTAHTFQKVTISGYTTSPTYNGTFIITDTDGTTYFEISKIAFDTAETGGAFVSDSITLTSAAHGRSNGDGLSVKDTINHNIGSYVYNVQTNTFQVNKAFTATETGIWDTSSLDQTDARVISLPGNAGLDPSFTIGSFTVTGNIAETDFSGVDPGDFIDLVFDASTTAILGINAELFEMVNPLNGEIRYIGKTKYKSTYDASLSHTKVGGTAQIYLFRAIVDGVDGAPIANEIRNTMGNTGLKKDVIILPNQKIKMQAANISGTDNLIVEYVNANV